jgi:membrane-associated protein
LFTRPNSRLFKQENVAKAHLFFERHGPKSIVLARFVPIVRTFTPIVAGIGGMRYRTFVTFNVLGGLLWAVGVTTLGHFLGEIEFFRDNIEYAIVAVVLFSLVPVFIEVLRARRHRGTEPEVAAGRADRP